MSMHEYCEYGIGLIITEEYIPNFVKQYKKEFNADDNFEVYMLSEDNNLKHMATYIEKDVQLITFGEGAFFAKKVIVITANKWASPFKAVYNSKEELIDEFKNDLKNLLPEDFDYEKYIGEYSYTAWG